MILGDTGLLELMISTAVEKYLLNLCSGENHLIIPQLLTCNNRELEIWKDVGREFHVDIYLRN